MATKKGQSNGSKKEQKHESTPAPSSGGVGRREDVRGSGVYPASGPWPEGDAPFRGMAEWGQGERGAAGYEDHGESELSLGPGALGKPPRQCRDLMTKDPVFGLPSDTVEM